MKKRGFIREVVTHCYQKTDDLGVLFYNESDRLLFYTIFYVKATRHLARAPAAHATPRDTPREHAPPQYKLFHPCSNVLLL